MSIDQISRRSAVVAAVAATVAPVKTALAQSNDSYWMRAPMRYIPQFTIDTPPSKTTIELAMSPFCPDCARFTLSALLPFLKKKSLADGSQAIFHQFARVESEVPMMMELLSYQRDKLIAISLKVMNNIHNNQRLPRGAYEIADAAKSVGAQKDPSFNAATAEAAVRKMNQLMATKIGVAATPTLFVNRHKIGFVTSADDLNGAIAKFGKA